MTWTYGPAGWIVDLNEYIKDPAKTSPTTTGTTCCRTSCVDRLGRRAGSRARLGAGPSSGHPMGLRAQLITYNRTIFDKVGVKPPKNLAELVESPRRSPRMPGGRTASACAAPLLGHHPSGLSCRRFANLRRSRTSTWRTASCKAAMNSQGVEGVPRQLGQDDPGVGPEELGDLHLVPGRHRPRRRRLRHDLRCRHPRLLHEWRRQQGEGQPRLLGLCAQSGRDSADAECLDLVAGA